MNRNITFSLPDTLIENIRLLINEGYRSSMASFVRETLEIKIKEVNQEKIKQLMIEAKNDELFLADVENCTKDFINIDKEWTTEW